MSQTPPIRRAARLGLDVELRAIRNSGNRFPHHWHDDVQVIATVRGVGEAHVEGRTYALPERALLVVPSRAVHTACATGPVDWVFHSLHVPARRIFRRPEDAAMSLHASSTDPIASLFARLVADLFDARADVVATRERFFASLQDLAGRAAPPRPRHIPEGLSRARATLGERLAGPLDLDGLAASHGYSRKQFDRAFAQHFFMPPYAWWLNARTEAAKRRLRAGESVGEAARRTGFTDPTQFSRRYRTGTGLTARTYASSYRRRP